MIVETPHSLRPQLKMCGCIPIGQCNLNSIGRQQTEPLKPLSGIDPHQWGQFKGGLLHWGMVAWGLSDVTSLSSRPGSAATCGLSVCLTSYLSKTPQMAYEETKICPVLRKNWAKNIAFQIKHKTFGWQIQFGGICLRFTNWEKRYKYQVCLWPAALTPNLFSCPLGISNERSTA